MPQYEYQSIEDGEVITLLRSMSDADRAVEDPAGKGRTFKRRHSVFGVGASSDAAPQPGSCACGLKPGTCGGG